MGPQHLILWVSALQCLPGTCCDLLPKAMGKWGLSPALCCLWGKATCAVPWWGQWVHDLPRAPIAASRVISGPTFALRRADAPGPPVQPSGE